MSKGWLSTLQAAKRLGVSEASVRRWSDRGLLPVQRVGKRLERRFQAGEVGPLLPPPPARPPPPPHPPPVTRPRPGGGGPPHPPPLLSHHPPPTRPHPPLPS